jgi:hypothetical protein
LSSPCGQFKQIKTMGLLDENAIGVGMKDLIAGKV